MRKHIKRFFKRLKEYNRIANIDEIGRRYFAMNSFDGILTILGILLGSFFAGIESSKAIITTGVGACIAMGVSGLWGTYLAESAERKKAIKDLEKHTLYRLSNTKIQKASQYATVIVSLIDGLSPFLAALLVLAPFLIPVPIVLRYFIAWGIAFLLLAFLGVFLGKISEESKINYMLKILFAGVVCVILSLGLSHF